jgi:hypothetical protein
MNLIRRSAVGESAKQDKAPNYPKRLSVNEAGIWDESYRSYLGRSGDALTEAGETARAATVYSDITCHFQKSAEVIVVADTSCHR